MSVDFLPCGPESLMIEAFLPSGVSVRGVFSWEEDMTTFMLDVLVSPRIVHVLVVKDEGCLSVDMCLEGESNFWKLSTI